MTPQVFAENFDLFPVKALQRCIRSCDIDQGSLLYRMAASAKPMHRAVHEELLVRVLEDPPKRASRALRGGYAKSVLARGGSSYY